MSKKIETYISIFLLFIKMTINIVVAFTTNDFGIGYKNNIPWHIPDDFIHFKNITQQSVVVMGRKTWESISPQNRPLKNRLNIVVSSKAVEYNLNENKKQVIWTTIEELDSCIKSFKNVFIIGGSSLYKKYMGVADKIFATIIESKFECDTFFPIDNFHKYEIHEYSEQKEFNGIKYRFIDYKKTEKKHGEFGYLSLLDDIIKNGIERQDRTKVGTHMIFSPNPLRFDISKTLPMITTKFVPFLLTLKELIFFLKGQTDSKILEQQGVSIWKQNTSREFLDDRGLNNYEVGWLGDMYGYNWRFYGHPYEGANVDYRGRGFDQLTNLIKGLKEDPFSRRHVITTFNPSTVSESVLMECHGISIVFNCQEREENMHLSCQVTIRSSDLPLGFPINLASYAILTCIIAKKCNMKPGDLVLVTGDTHIYNNVLEQVNLQLSRSPLPFPIMTLDDSVKDTNFEDISLEQFKLIGYLHHPSIKMPMAV